MLFYDRENCLHVSKHIDKYGTNSGIFVFKNIIPENLMDKIEEDALLKQTPIDHKDTLIDWYSEKFTPPLDGLHELWEIISEILYPNWVMHPCNSLLKSVPGDKGMFVHSDSPGKDACHLLSQIDIWSTCCSLDYGVVAYLGNFEGGEIFYPNINPDGSVKTTENSSDLCFEYKPERGDVVIHSSFNPYEHGVREVTSGTRYAFACFSLKAEDNPGSFYNYKTKEYYDQIGDKKSKLLAQWAKPLTENHQFTPEVIKKIQASGLTGEDVAKEFFSDMKK